jgi:20S proteasome alpha/beta subunit
MFVTVLCVCFITFTIAMKPDKVTSPIKNLESSLAASAAKSTVIAVKNSPMDCVILLCTSDSRTRSKLTVLPTPSEIIQMSGIHLNRYEDDTFLSHSSRWSLLSPTCFGIMTGFSPDISHLTKVAAKLSASHEALQSQPLPIFKLVRSMSSLLQRETQREGARPYGIQALWIGWDSPQRKDLQLYTCDPTGMHRHISGGIAVIGRRSGEDIRSIIMESTLEVDTNSESESTLATFQSCLKAMLRCSGNDWLPSISELKKKSSIDEYDIAAHWEGIFLHKSPTTGDLEANVINADFLRKVFREVISNLEDISEA